MLQTEKGQTLQSSGLQLSLTLRLSLSPCCYRSSGSLNIGAAKRGDKTALGILAAIGEEATGRAAEFGPREIANIAWAFSTAGIRCEALFDALADEVPCLL